MRSVRSRLLFTEAARQKFGRTTGTSRPRSSRMIECTARLRDLAAQSRKFCSQFVVAHEAARHARPHPPARIGERRKCRAAHARHVASSLATRMIVLPGSRGSRRQRLRSRLRSDRIPARWMRSTSPEGVRPPAAPVWQQHSAVAEAGRPAAHPSRLAGLAQAIESRAARHLAVRPIAEPRAADHEVLALRFGLKSGDAAGSWVSPASE